MYYRQCFAGQFNAKGKVYNLEIVFPDIFKTKAEALKTAFCVCLKRIDGEATICIEGSTRRIIRWEEWYKYKLAVCVGNPSNYYDDFEPFRGTFEDLISNEEIIVQCIGVAARMTD